MPKIPFKANNTRKRPLSPSATEARESTASSDAARGSKSCKLQQQQLQLQLQQQQDSLQERLFHQYEESNSTPLPADDDSRKERAIRDDGVAALCRDLQLDPVDIRLLLFAWQCVAREMCAFQREEFLRGCRALRASSVGQLRAALDAKLTEMTSPGGGQTALEQREAAFKELYRWTFEFGLETGQRTVLLPMALDLWGLVFGARASGAPLILPAWLAWLRSGSHGVKGITRDTWIMFLTFADTCAADLSAYEQSEAWPSLIDDFVESEADRTNQNVLSDS